MKRKLISMSVMLFTAFLFYNFGLSNQNTPIAQLEKQDLSINADVQKIIDNSCVGCHNAESKNDKAKTKLMFESLDTLSVAKLVGKLADISEEVGEDKMPPAKFLEFKPDAKLTPEQKAALIKWADMTSNALLEKK